MIDALPTTEIIVTAERAPEKAQDTAASVTLIDSQSIERLGEPLVPALLRLTPSISVATSGPAGSLTEVRIRGAENNHTLLFVDGIRANDPATGNQPRFELLNSDVISRIEVVRGPQSALWGSEAVGGVVAVDGLGDSNSFALSSEVGSFGFRRASASGSAASEAVALSGGLGWQRATGIDAFDGNGDKDGYRNLSGRIRGTWNVAPAIRLGASAFAMSGRSEFDGYNRNPPFQHTDTLDSSRNRLSAGRLWGEFGEEKSAWRGRLGGSILSSRNRNFLAGDEINRSSGHRTTLDAQIQRRFPTSSINHRLILAVDHESEGFNASDVNFGGATGQARNRKHNAVTAEWRADAGLITADLAVRRDAFNRFKDATTVRASLLADVGKGFSVTGSYGEGIAQPTFFDLYGFFPNSFVGNPSLKPERSRGIEASIRYASRDIAASLTAYRQRLHDEIVDTFDPDTFLSSTANRSESSKRSGVEAQANWSLGDPLRLSANYAYLNASEPNDLGSRVREARRPKHSGSVAADGQLGQLTYGLSLAYSGSRIDTDFETFPFQRVKLGSYWLAGARISREVARGIQLFARATNAFDERYQDALGYRTEGRSIYGGIRFVRGR